MKQLSTNKKFMENELLKRTPSFDAVGDRMNRTFAERRLKIANGISVEKITVEYPALKIADIVSAI